MGKEETLSILVVEDDLVCRDLLQHILQGWGHSVLVAKDGEEAVGIIKKENVKFVIADWLMPVMDGLTLCRKVRSLKGTGYVYFILVTSRDRREDIIEGLNAGADDYVIKPLDSDDLRVRIRAGQRILGLEKELTEKNRRLLALNARLEELARIDPLMNIGNRRSFHETMDKVHHRACRYERSYGVIMCDIDNFKAYNDTYGHIAGDSVLRTIADSIKKTLRVSDDIFRYGGEEIVIILAEQNLDTAAIVAQRIRQDIEALRIEHKASERGIITVSCGVSAFDGECGDTRWEPTLERADKALYTAKTRGKNMVFCLSRQKVV